MDDRYVEICGITEKEIHTCLEDEVRELAGAQDMTYEETCLRLKECYDGYHFVENSIGMYNPFSLLNSSLAGNSAIIGSRPVGPLTLLNYSSIPITTFMRWRTRRPMWMC